MIAGLVLVAYRLFVARTQHLDQNAKRRQWLSLLITLTLIMLVASAVLWSGRDRMTRDVAAFSPEAQTLPWDSSAAIRLNLWLTGIDLFQARPWLGWGPGTDGNKVLVPLQVVEFSPSTLTNAPDWSHMHSVLVEALVRFGLTSLLIALPLAWLLLRSGRWMWLRLAQPDPRLREFLILTALMMLLFLVYEYRLVHVDMRFFVQLFLGIWYSFWLHRDSVEGRA
jgi:O-antigen ligase